MRRSAAAAAPPALAALGYIRVSDPKQIEGVSLEQQRAAIRGFAKRARIPLIDILEDADESAKSWTGRRCSSSSAVWKRVKLRW